MNFRIFTVNTNRKKRNIKPSKWRILSITLIIFGSLIPFLVQSQSNPSIQQVLIADYQEKTPLVGVHITGKSESKVQFQTVSDYDGLASIPTSFSNGKIIFQFVGYQKLVLEITEITTNPFPVYMKEDQLLLNEVTITATRQKERIDEITNRVEVIKAEEIQAGNPQTSATLLEQNGLYVQRSQMGGGSPVIRGFEANKVLLVVDGVRLNNAIYRGGHLQNAITIDPNVLERTEVVFGPGSVIYGSDALGGVIHFISKTPEVSPTGIATFKGLAMMRYASANHEKTGHLDFAIGGKKFGSLTSITLSDFNDLRIGTRRNHGYQDWGKRPFYVESFEGQDSLVANKNQNILRETGYRQMDIQQKFYFPLKGRFDLTLNSQYSTSSNIPRFDRLNDTTDDGLKFAEWYYGPQKRFLGSLKLSTDKKMKLYDGMQLIAAYQRISEDRINRKFNDDFANNREEDLHVLSLQTDYTKKWSTSHQLQYGFETQHNIVKSTAYATYAGTETVVIDENVSTRYPDNGSSMTSAAIYLRHKWKVSDKITLTPGMRYSWFKLKASFTDTTFFSLPEPDYSGNFSALTGSLGLLYKVHPNTRLSFIAATGFRAPNIDDATKVFDPTDEIVVVPNLEIKPEYVYNAEIGIQQRVSNKLRISGQFYYTYLTQLINRQPFTLGNNLDTLFYEGSYLNIYANTNSDKARIAGFGLQARYQITDYLMTETAFQFTNGKNISNDSPLGHIPPSYGHLSIQLHKKKWRAAFHLRYNAWKDIDQYSTGSEDKPEEATIDGTPSWYTLNLRASTDLSESIQLSLVLENILDQHYKPFASGNSAPGFNAVIALRARL